MEIINIEGLSTLDVRTSKAQTYLYPFFYPMFPHIKLRDQLNLTLLKFKEMITNILQNNFPRLTQKFTELMGTIQKKIKWFTFANKLQ